MHLVSGGSVFKGAKKVSKAYNKNMDLCKAYLAKKITQSVH